MKYQMKLSANSAFMNFQYKGRQHQSLNLDLVASTEKRSHIVETFALLEAIVPIEVGYETFRNSKYLFTGENGYWYMVHGIITGAVSKAVDEGKIYPLQVEIHFDLYGRLVEREDSNENIIWFSVNFEINRISNDFFQEMQDMAEDLEHIKGLV